MKIKLTFLLLIAFATPIILCAQIKATPADSKEADIKVAATYFDCLFKTRDFATMATIIADSAVYNQAEGLPYGGTYIGLTNWVKMYTKAQAYFNLKIEGEPSYFTTAKKHEVIIYFKITCESLRSHKELSMNVAEFFEIKDHKIMNIRPFYFDTKTFTEFLQ